jgi:hypothetical protein
MRRAVVNFGKRPEDSLIPIATNPTELKVVYSIINILKHGAMNYVDTSRDASNIRENVNDAIRDGRANHPSRVPDEKSSNVDHVGLPLLPRPGKRQCRYVLIYCTSVFL